MALAAEQAEATADQSYKEIDLNGKYSFKVDSKGRVALPAKFRKVLSKELVVSLNPHDECLYIFENDGFNQWIEDAFVARFGKYNSTDQTHIKLRRKLKSRACDAEVDSTGRIMLPAELRKVAGITKDVVIIGNKGYFEIWDAQRFEGEGTDIDLGLLFSNS